jgi:ribosome-associated protein
MSDELPSKTRRKREMHELQALGAELVALNDDQLSSMALPERLMDAVLDARRMLKHEARRRQLQFIGKIMRTVDAGPIREQLAAWQVASRAHTARLHSIERWRARLLEDDRAIAELLRAHPHADASRLRTLVRNAKREQAAGQPPKSFRALFQLLNQAIAAEPDTEGAAQDASSPDPKPSS